MPAANPHWTLPPLGLNSLGHLQPVEKTGTITLRTCPLVTIINGNSQGMSKISMDQQGLFLSIPTCNYYLSISESFVTE